jgi:hypothetical protein
LVHLRARDYDPQTGQFLTVDPAVEQTTQPYTYAANNRLQLTGHTGLDVWTDAWAHAWSSAGDALAKSWTDAGNKALAFGAGALNSVTFGASGAIMSAVVPGYDCLVAENSGFYAAGEITGTVASFAVPGAGLISGARAAVASVKTAAAAVEAMSAVTKPAAHRAIDTATRVSPWAGSSVSRLTTGNEIAYRVYGGGAAREGSWITPVKPSSSAATRQGLGLPQENAAIFVSQVTLPAGVRMQVGEAAPAFGNTGGWPQAQLLQRIPSSAFGPGERLP